MNEQKIFFPNNSIKYSISSISYFREDSQHEREEFLNIGSPLDLEKEIILYPDGKLISIKPQEILGTLNNNKLKLMDFIIYPVLIRYAYNLKQVYSTSSKDLLVFCGKSYKFICQDFFTINSDGSEKIEEFNEKQRLSISHLREVDKFPNLKEFFHQRNLNKKLKLFEKIEKEKLEKCFPKESDWNLEKITDNTILELRLIN